MVFSFTILFIFLATGEIISTVLGLNIPGSVIGMLLLAAGLCSGYIKEEWVRPAGRLLIDNMALLFVPPGVGLILYLTFFKDNFIVLTAALVISTLVTMAATGFVQQILEKRKDHK